MELYEAIDKRRTTREFSDKQVDFEAIKRIWKRATKLPLGITTVIGISLF